MESVMHMLIIVVILISMIGVIVYIGAPTANTFKMIGAKTANAMGTNASIAAIVEPYPVETMLKNTGVNVFDGGILGAIGTIVGAGVLYGYAKGEEKKQPTQIIFKPQKKPATTHTYIHKYENITSATPVERARFVKGGAAGTKSIKNAAEIEKLRVAQLLSAENTKGYRMKYGGDEAVILPMPQEEFKKRPTKSDIERLFKEAFSNE